MESDTLSGFPISPDAVEVPIFYDAEDTMRMDMPGQMVYLVNNATATYGDVYLSAYYIELDLVTSEVYAYGRKDSTGNYVDTPVFREGSQEFESKELHYNFKTRRALINNIITEQEGGFLHSDITKMHDDGNLHVQGSKYTTCDAPHPHFYMSLNKAKMIPGEKIISGPAYLVVEDIPLPLALPFGYFPVQKEVSSGIIIPQYGEENRRGYFMKGGGYYFAVSDYFDFRVTGDLYSNGTWRLNTGTNYRKRYKYNGNFSFNYANNVSGHKGLEDFTKSTNYSVRWTHSQDAKARPGSRFSASVNMSSTGYDKENSYVVSDHINSTKQSSISYTKSWKGTPFNLSSSVNQSQNSGNKSVSFNLPRMTFGMGRIYPLKSKSSGSTKWWQELQVQYTAKLDNRLNTVDTVLFTPQMWDELNNGFKHDIPITIPLRPFNNFSISPQLRYSGVLYTKRMEKTWEERYYDPVLNDTIYKLVEEEIPGLFYGQAFSPSIGAGYSPQIFGTYVPNNPDSRIIAIRHVLKPAVSFSYIPALDGWSTDMYREVQKDTLGNIQEYSIFENSIYGTPALSKRSSAVSFSLTNIIEAKVGVKNDTTGKEEKVKIIENFALNTSYNLFADSLNWSPLTMTIRTRLLKEISVTARGAFDFYTVDELNRKINTTVWESDGKPFRMTSFNLSLGFDLKRVFDNIFSATESESDQGGSSGSQRSMGKPGGPGGPGRIEGGDIPDPFTSLSEEMMFDEYGYTEFNVPWSLRVAYNFYYSKRAIKPTINQNLTLNGRVTLTSNWGITYSTGYDFRMKEITMTRVGITRDLHCWEMSLNWIPAGYMKSWDFTIRAKASLLQDLKYERRKDYHDN
ncbi:MAG: hypothetical protein K8R35_10930 [Bacteroidales bacterium]|nr:hypothetical protein [Bacteroidales bacterium]